MRVFLLSALLFSLPAALSAQKRIEVHVALCDNATQGIQPVGATIGDGNVPSANLYWGCSDGMSSYFKKSSQWKLLESETGEDGAAIMETLTFRHSADEEITLIAYAWRGSEMKASLETFLQGLSENPNNADLIAFIGHNGLMDVDIALPESSTALKRPDTVILCCVSEGWFLPTLQKLDVRPILLTDQFMYPGSFLLHAALEGWLKEESTEEIRVRAGRAYAANQGISTRAATGVFAELE